MVGEIDEQLQDAANVGFQEGLLPAEEIAEEQWRLKDGAMAAFNTIFKRYKTIITGFMELSKLIGGTDIMGHILNAIQDSAARSVGYREGEDEGGVEGEGEAEEEVRWGGAERLDKDNDDRTCQISKRKKTTPKKRDTCDIQEDTTLKVSPGPPHDLVKDEELAKARSKEGKRKVKKVGPGDTQSSLPNIIYWGKVLPLRAL